MNASNYRSAAALLLAAAVGCDAPALPTGPATPPAASTPAEKEKPIVAGVPGEELPEDEIPITATPRPFHWRDPVKGRRTRRAGGYLGTTLATKFKAEYELNVIIPLTQALQIFEIENNRYPESNDEYMEKVVKINHISLPELPEYAEYIYVPDQPEKGLQVRLKPGAAPPTADEDEQAAESSSAPAAPESSNQPAAASAPGEPEGGRDDAGNPLDLRERAAGFGGVSPTDGLSE